MAKHYSQMTREEAEQAVQEAEAVLRAEYYSDVRGLADDIKSELRDKLVAGEGGEPLREWLIEHLDYLLDSHHRIIYTWQAQKVLLFSENSDAYIEEFGNAGFVEGDSINWSQLAFYAMRADLVDQLDAEGIDVNEPDGDDTCDKLELANEFVRRLSAANKLEEAADLLNGDWREEYGDPADVVHDMLSSDRAELAALLK